MTARKIAVSLFVLSAWAAPIVAQSVSRPAQAAKPAAAQAVKAPKAYDATAEVTVEGAVNQVLSGAAEDGNVGVHLVVKDLAGKSVKVHVGPAMFIGMNNFSFLMDDKVKIVGSFVTHDGDVALWAREVMKGESTLTLRDPDGTPRWPRATAEDPDGCGVTHAPIR
jgi:hypothetical protein